MEQISLVDLKAQYTSVRSEVDAAMQRVLENTSFILGREVANFEQAFASYIGATGMVGVASGTAAVHLALLACGVKPGDEVITTAHTFVATAEVVSQIGARPVFVDVEPQTCCLDPNLVEAAITPQTKAILPVHIYGHPANMDPLLDIAQRHNLFVVEDAAQAHGATYNGRHCGTLGHLASFSFFPAKNLGAFGDAGGVTGNDEALLAKVRMLRNHGRTDKYEHEEVGYGERLDALQAAVLGAKLPYLESWTETRRAHARLYKEMLVGCGDIVTPYEMPNARHVYCYYVIRTRHRDELLTYLKSKGIGVGIHYPIPLHRQPVYLKQGYRQVILPVTEQIAQEILTLPMYAELTTEQISYIVDQIKEFFNDY